MLEVFGGGEAQGLKRLMGRRNYAVVLAFDPEAVEGAFNGAAGYVEGAAGGLAANGKMPGSGLGRVSLAVDLMVQSDAAQGQQQMQNFAGVQGLTVKYGPIIVSSYFSCPAKHFLASPWVRSIALLTFDCFQVPNLEYGR